MGGGSLFYIFTSVDRDTKWRWRRRAGKSQKNKKTTVQLSFTSRSICTQLMNVTKAELFFYFKLVLWAQDELLRRWRGAVKRPLNGWKLKAGGLDCSWMTLLSNRQDKSCSPEGGNMMVTEWRALYDKYIRFKFINNELHLQQDCDTNNYDVWHEAENCFILFIRTADPGAAISWSQEKHV